jgi:hypothetical protein
LGVYGTLISAEHTLSRSPSILPLLRLLNDLGVGQWVSGFQRGAGEVNELARAWRRIIIVFGDFKRKARSE